jgi:hypothetical protein
VLRIVGIVGTILLLRRAWWAPPLALLIVGTQVLRALVLLRFVSTGHAFILFYSGRVVGYLLVLAGVLIVARFVVWAMRRLAVNGPPRLALRHTAVTIVAVFVSLLGYASWNDWAPGPRGVLDQVAVPAPTDPLGKRNLAMDAHAERLPDGTAVHFPAPTLSAPLDMRGVVAAVRTGMRGARHPLVLSYDQRLYSYRDWRDWLPPDRTAASALVRWDARYAELQRLAAIEDPQQFASASAHTSRGRIDVFYFRASGGVWRFLKFVGGPSAGSGVAFRPQQFAAPEFAITHLMGGNVVVVRRP